MTVETATHEAFAPTQTKKTPAPLFALDCSCSWGSALYGSAGACEQAWREHLAAVGDPNPGKPFARS